MKILPYSDPFLRTVAKPVEKITAEILDKIEEMIRLMHAEGGVGLAAVQVGWDARVFVMNARESEDPYMDMAWINPRLKLGPETAVSIEGCLSVRDHEDTLILGKVLRSRKVTVTGVGLARLDCPGERNGKFCFFAEGKHREDLLAGGMHECSWDFSDEPQWTTSKKPNIEPFIVQHETDHLEGIVFLDKLVSQ